MQDLTLIGVHEDGAHLLLTDRTGARYRLPLDEPLRAAARKDRPRLGQLQIEIDGGLRPRDVQTLIRQGLSAAEVADRSGWTVEKVRRFEGPVLAEREWIALKAQGVSVARDGSAHPTLLERSRERFRTRGVEPETVEWDSARLDSGHWVVTVSFPAGGRLRSASWRYDPATGALRAQNDDARWLGEDDQPSALHAPHSVDTGRSTDEVFDVAAPPRGPVRARPSGRGISSTGSADTPFGATASSSSATASTASAEDELTSSIRAHHSSLRDRRGRRRTTQASSTPGESGSPTDVLPLEPLAMDLEGLDPPPARPRLVPLLPDEEESTPAKAAEESTEESNEESTETAEKSSGGSSGEPSAGATTPTGSTSASARRGRARVPTWDDVVFGTRSRNASADDHS